MTLGAYGRFFVVVSQFLPLLVAYARDRRRYLLFGPGRSVSKETRRRRARSLLESLLTLGPTFVKLGQLLSTRPDILPPAYIEEFESLQDRVPPAEWSAARTVLEAELGPVEDAFDDFQTEAISGASLGQVYVAELDDQTVAVKVRRPNVEELVAADLRVIRWTLPVLVRFVHDAQAFSLETLADEFAKTIREEMDYRRERQMLEEIGSNLESDDRVRVPDAIPSHSTERVLTMEYVGGTKISELEDIDSLGLDRTEIATTIQRTYLRMIVEDGVYHADPHPGNLAVQDDGTIVFYDFGMSGRADPFVRDKIVQFYVAIARQDTDEILDTLIELGTLSPDADREVMANVMELAIADVRGEDIEQYRVQQIISQVDETIYEFPFRLPPHLALVLRVATVVEGVCIRLDPDFDFIEVATAYLREQGHLERGARDYLLGQSESIQDLGESLVRVPPKLEAALDTIGRGNLSVEVDFPAHVAILDRLAIRLVLGGLLSALVVSAGVLFALSTPTEAAVPLAFAVLVGLLLWRSFRKHRGIRTRPQFTRQTMRQRENERR